MNLIRGSSPQPLGVDGLPLNIGHLGEHPFPISLAAGLQTFGFQAPSDVPKPGFSAHGTSKPMLWLLIHSFHQVI